MSETISERLDNLELFLLELSKDSPAITQEIQDQANYHLATIDLIKGTNEKEMKGKIFSGDNSRPLWDAINKAKTITDLRETLYTLACYSQNLEEKLSEVTK